MRSRVRENLPAALGALAGILIVAWLGLTDWAWTDYDREARPAFDALVNGHVVRFLQLAPSYGGSLILRAPFVLLTKLWTGGEYSIFRAAAAPCLIASAALGVWLVARLRARGAPLMTRVLVLALCTANPITLLALETGHPEELLGAVLCVAAVLAGLADRPLWSGLLFGLAVANQEWALIAAGPVLLALPARRGRAALTGAAVAAVILLPLVMAGNFLSQTSAAATPNNLIFSPWQIWWFFGPHLHHVMAAAPWATRLDPEWLSVSAHPLIVAISLPLTLLCVWLRRGGFRRPEHEALLLLAVVLLLRCMLDPWDNWYYPLPFLIVLLVWETDRSVRPPVLALIGCGAWWALTQWAVPHGLSNDGQSLVFLAMAVPALAVAATALYAPGVTERLMLRLTRQGPEPSPA
jgi:Glycosyltransferase family 87